MDIALIILFTILLIYFLAIRPANKMIRNLLEIEKGLRKGDVITIQATLTHMDRIAYNGHTADMTKFRTEYYPFYRFKCDSQEIYSALQLKKRHKEILEIKDDNMCIYRGMPKGDIVDFHVGESYNLYLHKKTGTIVEEIMLEEYRKVKQEEKIKKMRKM